jgi:hypothetical protein
MPSPQFDNGAEKPKPVIPAARSGDHWFGV